jgi:hypothetical protein
MYDRKEFVEPLVRMTIYSPSDFFMRCGISARPIALYALSSVDQSHNLGLHRLMISLGIYDDLYSNLPPQIYLSEEWSVMSYIMSHGLEQFEYFRANYFPNFYEWPEHIRLENLAYIIQSHKMSTNITALPRFFRDTDVFCAEDFRRKHVGFPLFALATRSWFCFRRKMSYPWNTGWWNERWETQRRLCRAMASVLDISDLVRHISVGWLRRKDRGTVLFQSLTGMWRRGIWAINGFRCPNQHCSRCFRSQSSSDITEMINSSTLSWVDMTRETLRLWVEDLQMAGQDLVAYGEAEMAAFVQTSYSGLSKECYQQDGEWHSRFVRYELKGFKYGPNPEDWDVLMDGETTEEEGDDVDSIWFFSEDEEDDTEQEKSKDLVSEPQRQQLMPGAWVDDDFDDDDEEEK